MTVQEIAGGLNWLLIGFSGLAALFWLLAARAKVKAEGIERGDIQIIISDGHGGSRFSADGMDVFATARLQTRWNTFAASFACAAAVCQAVISWLPKPL
jgi:hypothetical protein